MKWSYRDQRKLQKVDVFNQDVLKHLNFGIEITETIPWIGQVLAVKTEEENLGTRS